VIDPTPNPSGFLGASGSQAPLPPFFSGPENPVPSEIPVSYPAASAEDFASGVELRVSQLGAFLSDHSPTESLAEVADLIIKIACGDVRDSRLPKLLNLADKLVENGADIQHAKSAHECFLQQLVAAPEQDKIDSARAYEAYAAFLIRNGEFAEATAYAEKSLYLRDEIHGGNQFVQIGLRFCLSLLHDRIGNHDRAAIFLANAYDGISELVAAHPIEAIAALRDFSRSAISYGKTDWAIRALQSVDEIPAGVQTPRVKLAKTLVAIELGEIFTGLDQLDVAAKSLLAARRSLASVQYCVGLEGDDSKLRIEVDLLSLSIRSGRTVSAESIRYLFNQISDRGASLTTVPLYQVTLAESAYATGHAGLALDLVERASQSYFFRNSSESLLYRSHMVRIAALQSLGRFSEAAEYIEGNAGRFRQLSPTQQAGLLMQQFECLINQGVAQTEERPTSMLREILGITASASSVANRIGSGVRAKAFLYRALEGLSRQHSEGAEHFLAEAQAEARMPGCFVSKSERISFSVCSAELLHARGDSLKALGEAEGALAMLSALAGNDEPRPSMEYHRLLVLLEFLNDFGQPGNDARKRSYYHQQRLRVEKELNILSAE
jgi:hypothetical protein